MEARSPMINILGYMICPDLIIGIGPLILHEKNEGFIYQWFSFTLFLTHYAIDISADKVIYFADKSEKERLVVFKGGYSRLSAAIAVCDFKELLIETSA